MVQESGRTTDPAGAPATPPRAKKPGGPVGRIAGRERHILPGWYEWTLREFLRYFYALGVLSLLAFVPLQMGESWLPTNGTAVMSPGEVAALVLAFFVGLLVAAGFGYSYLWGEDGLMDRLIERHFDLLHEQAGADKD